MEKILVALRQLDPLNDDHWTINGDPRIDAVKAIAGPGVEVDRQTIINAAPALSRTTSGQPESLLLVAPDEPNSDPVPDSAIFEEIEADEGQSLASFLLGNYLGVVGDLLYKALAQRQSLSDQEMLVVQSSLSVDDLVSFVVVMEAVQKGYQESIDRSSAEIKAFRRMTSIVKNQLNVVRPEQSNGDAIRVYLDAQNRSRAEAAQQRSIVLKNLDLKSLTPLSQLDQSMARKTARGTQRPTY